MGGIPFLANEPSSAKCGCCQRDEYKHMKPFAQSDKNMYLIKSSYNPYIEISQLQLLILLKVLSLHIVPQKAVCNFSPVAN